MQANAILTIKLRSEDFRFNFSTKAELEFNLFGASMRFFTLEESLLFENSIAVSSNEKLVIYKGLADQDLSHAVDWVGEAGLRLMQQGKILIIEKDVNHTNAFAKYEDTNIGLNGKYLKIAYNEKEVSIDFERVSLKKRDKGSQASLSLRCFKTA
jgi:hypothetical protein